MNESKENQENLILQYNIEYRHNYEDITYKIELFEKSQNAYKIKYIGNDTIYHKKLNHIKILTKPQIIDCNKYEINHSNMQLDNVIKILKYNQWFKVVFENGTTKTYHEKEVKLIKNKRSDKKIKMLIDYLTEIATIEDNNFLLSQLSNFCIDEESCLYKFIADDLRREQDGKIIILPFSSNESQKKAIKIAMEHDLSVIQGPPGTGKTQTILNIIANCIFRGKSIAIVSGNNSATKNVLDKLNNQGYGFLNAFLGNEDNIVKFFEKDEIKFTPQKDDEIVSTIDIEERLNRENNAIENCMISKTRIAELKQTISEYQKEKEINAAEFNFRESKVLKAISNKNYTYRKFLELAAVLDSVSDKQLTSFFNRARLLFRYGITKVKKLSENKIDNLGYIKDSYYNKKISNLSDEINKLELTLKSIDDNKCITNFYNLSKQIFEQTLVNTYLEEKFPEFNKANYKLYFNQFVKRYPVIYSTTHSIRSCSADNYLYDYLIIDESSQVDLITASIAFSCAKKVVVVGDEMQITHVISSSLEKSLNEAFIKSELPEFYDYANNNILQTIRKKNPNVPSTLLREHYRCDPQIISFCNKRFYDNKLIVMTEHEEGSFIKIIKHPSHSEYMYTNEREAQSVVSEIIPELEKVSTGIMAPYNNQINLLSKCLVNNNEYTIETIHKFQGKECDCVILCVVNDKITKYSDRFINSPNLINVAISRAKKILYILVSDKVLNQRDAILRDFSKYCEFYCNDTKIVDSMVYSVFDLLYEDYLPILNNMARNLLQISRYKSENIIATVIDEIIKSDKRFTALSFWHNLPLKFILKTVNIEDNEDLKFVNNIATHCDFVIFNTLDKSIELIIEVDGKTFHTKKQQARRDARKDRLLKNAGIKILRLPTTAVNCREKIIEKLIE